MPFRSMVEYHRACAKDQPRLHQFGKKFVPGKLLGYALFAGGILERRCHREVGKLGRIRATSEENDD